MIFTTVIDYCKSNGIQGMAFSPNATGRLFNHPLINEIAAKYGVTIPQLDERYDLQLGVLPLPRSIVPAHIEENTKLDFLISDEDMQRLTQVEEIQSLDL